MESIRQGLGESVQYPITGKIAVWIAVNEFESCMRTVNMFQMVSFKMIS